MSKELREQFEKENGMNFFQFPMLYANWIEAKLEEAEERNKELRKSIKIIEDMYLNQQDNE